MIIRTITYELYPNAIMKKVLDQECDYRRYCWNKALAFWNALYQAHKSIDYIQYTKFTPKFNKKTKKWSIEQFNKHLNPSPNWRLVRNFLVSQKQDWQYEHSARILQLSIQDLGKAWQNFFDRAQPDWGMPKFRSKKAPRQGFKTDRAKIINNQLVLDCPRKSPFRKAWKGIKLSEKPLDYHFGVISIYREKNKYYACIPYQVENPLAKAKTGRITGVDVNVGHFDYFDGQLQVLPKRLDHYYKQIKHYQRQLAKKRVINGKKTGTKSKRYLKTRTKLQIAYQRAHNLQHDLMHKFTTFLVNNYDQIVIENLSVKGMLMSHIASKGIHRSMFGLFRKLLTYKCSWYDKKLIIANKLYPSTQRCAICGTVKKGDDKITLRGNRKHGTRHNEFVCYNPNCPNYLKVVDRDFNAMLNLTLLAIYPELNRAL